MLTSHSQCENGTLRITVERWHVDGTERPTFVQSHLIQVSCPDIDWSLYNTPCSQKVAFLPQSTCTISPGPVAFLDDGAGLRIGSCILVKKKDSQSLKYIVAGSENPRRTASDERANGFTDESVVKSNSPEGSTIDISEDTAKLKKYCEEVAHRGNLLVICRRRIPKSKPTRLKPRKNRNKQSQSARSDSDSNDDDDNELDLERNSENDEEDEDGAPPFSDTSSLRPGGSSDSLVSASDDNEDSETSLEHDSPSSGSETDDFDKGSSSAESCDSSDSTSSLAEAEESDSDDTDSSSLLSVPSSESSDDEMYEQQPLAENGLDIQGDYHYPVEITDQPMAICKYCDQCREGPFETWYHCLICSSNDYDLCHQCVKSGEWCLDKKHQLYEEISGEGVVSIISWSDFIPSHELLIFDTNSTMDQPIFTRSTAENVTLHRSGPAIHPLLSLVVWPVCAEKLLFVDASKIKTSKKRCFSEQIFKATSKKGKVLSITNFNNSRDLINIIDVARQISIDVFFSPTGDYLHLGSVEAQRSKSANSSRVTNGISLHEKGYDLALHVTTMKLSSTNPAKGRPIIISRQCHALGKWTNPFVSTLPYSWTWTRAAVYFTMTGFKLRVYRIPLPSTKETKESSVEDKSMTADASCCSPALITTPRETIFLPRSARERSVHFYPCPETPSRASLEKPGERDKINKPNSTLIIGPRYGPKASPPIGVYLSEQDLGPWINIHDKEGEERMRPPKRRFTGPFEEFDEDDDCDIIPFDNGY